MLEAMWSLEFISSQQRGGYGIAVLETGRIFGGDSSCIYIGSYEVKNDIVHALVKVTNDRGILQTIFGDLKEFTLVLNGRADQDSFVLEGHMQEHPEQRMDVRLTRRAELP